jgi:hypothetical protein
MPPYSVDRSFLTGASDANGSAASAGTHSAVNRFDVSDSITLIGAIKASPVAIHFGFV